MTTGYIRDILQDEILLALATEPAASAFNLVKRGSLQGNIESFDTANSPAVIVQSPHLMGCSGQSGGADGSGVQRFEYTVELHVHGANFNPEDSEDDASQYECAVRVSLSNYESTPMTRIGWCRNSARFAPVGWVRRGQNTLYQINVSYVLYAPANGLVDIA